MTSLNKKIEEEGVGLVIYKNSLTAEIDKLRQEIEVLVNETKKTLSIIANEAIAKARNVRDANTAAGDSKDPTST